MKEEDIKESKVELLECIENLMGVFDTPVVRLKYKNEFTKEAIEIGRKLLENNGRGVYSR